ncbi:transcription elongation factor GreA [Sporobacter termitidis DSM 10068]|uniref:Transcription elongation factor GreA n=1 Tax=Sporobacter termitidis DSM 10068 TaxID=1123282 RepID=A0A1M5ZEP4_9FIRM|nr:GreA/GreB family elongation factor [Sporobacter termitidis]SHI22619.1 transcription elongation factor GreA [Sporobacter termitidis DSM 10068]
MTNCASLKDPLFEKLNRQLTDIANITARVDRNVHSADVVKETESLSDYAGRLSELLKHMAQAGQEIGVPFVIINCSVEVYDTSCDELIEYHIVNSKVFELEGNDVTFSSPIGRALLFRKVGDTVEFTIPVGKITYIIKSIRFDDDLSIEYEIT